MLKGPMPLREEGRPLLNCQLIFMVPWAVLWYNIPPPRHTLIVSPFFKTFPLARIPAITCASLANPKSNDMTRQSMDMLSLHVWYIVFVFLKIRIPGREILGIGDLPKKKANTKYKRNCENHSFLEKNKTDNTMCRHRLPKEWSNSL